MNAFPLNTIFAGRGLAYRLMRVAIPAVFLCVASCAAGQGDVSRTPESGTSSELAQEYIRRIDVQGLVLAELAGEAVCRNIPADRIPVLVRDISRAMDFAALKHELARMAAERFSRQDLQDLLNRSGKMDVPPLNAKIARFADEMGVFLRRAVDNAVLSSFGLTI